MKHLKQVVKNLAKLDSEKVLTRHVNLAYQWIKRKDLTLAENPKYTIKNIDYKLLTRIINFFSEKKISEKEMTDYLTSNNYGITKKHDNDFSSWNTKMDVDKSIFNNTYFCYFHPLFNEMYETNIFWYIRRFLRDIPMNPKIELTETSAVLTFKSNQGSVLVLIIEKNAKADSFIQYSFVLKNKIQSQGIMTLNTGHWLLDNELLDVMIKELLKENKFGDKNEEK